MSDIEKITNERNPKAWAGFVNRNIRIWVSEFSLSPCYVFIP